MGGCYQEESEICKLETILLGVGGAILGVGAIVGIVIAGVVCVGAATTASVATYNWVHTGNFDLKKSIIRTRYSGGSKSSLWKKIFVPTEERWSEDRIAIE